LRTWNIYIKNNLFITVYTDYESLKYFKTMRNPSKRLTRWLKKFGKYDLNIRYRKESETIVLNTINRRFNFINNDPRNLAFINLIKRMRENKLINIIIMFFRNGTQSPENTRTNIYKNISQFELGPDDVLIRILK